MKTKTSRPPSELRIQRIAAGLRIYDIERRTGIASTRVSQIERAEGAPPRPDELALIQEAIGAGSNIAKTDLGLGMGPGPTKGKR